MYVEDKYALRPRKENMYLEGYGKHWGEKLTFTIGVAYCATASLGFFVGMRRVRTNSLLSFAQKATNGFGQCARTAGEFGNSGAAASLLYCMIGKLIDLLFEEEIKDYGFMGRNAITGAVTGGLYKSTLGFRPFIFGSLLGAGIITGLTFVMNGLYDRGLISFRIEV